MSIQIEELFNKKNVANNMDNYVNFIGAVTKWPVQKQNKYSTARNTENIH